MEKDERNAITDERMERFSVSIWIRLAHVYAKMTHALTEQLRGWALSLAHFDVLVQVNEAEGLMQQELAQRLLVTKGNVCYLVDKLEQQHLLVRRNEGRVNRLFLTVQGQQLLAEVLPTHRKVLTSLFASLSSEDLSALLASLRTLDKALP
jgi:DNA-binding MarR family transcriptional regulator